MKAGMCRDGVLAHAGEKYPGSKILSMLVRVPMERNLPGDEVIYVRALPKTGQMAVVAKDDGELLAGTIQGWQGDAILIDGQTFPRHSIRGTVIVMAREVADPERQQNAEERSMRDRPR